MNTSHSLILGAWLCMVALSGCGLRNPPSETVAPNQAAVATSSPVPLSTAVPLASITPSIRPTDRATPVNTSPAPSATILSPSGITARLNEPFTLKPSQWATLPDANNTRVFFTNVLEDTRCALDINCSQVGSVRVAVTVESSNPTRVARFDLSSKPADYRLVGMFAGYVVQYVDIAPARTTANMPLPLSDYQLTLRVSAAPPSVAQARFNEPFTLKLGQSVGFDGSAMRLSFEAVKQDSRCPARVLCVTSGNATVPVRLVYDSVTQEQIILNVDGNPVMTSYPIVGKVSGYVRANALTPYPQQDFAGSEIASNEYAATFVVVDPAAAPATPASGATPTALAP